MPKKEKICEGQAASDNASVVGTRLKEGGGVSRGRIEMKAQDEIAECGASALDLIERTRARIGRVHLRCPCA
jgi:hypothetical protein